MENDRFSNPLDLPLSWLEREMVETLRRVRSTAVQQAILTFVASMETILSEDLEGHANQRNGHGDGPREEASPTGP